MVVYIEYSLYVWILNDWSKGNFYIFLVLSLSSTYLLTCVKIGTEHISKWQGNIVLLSWSLSESKKADIKQEFTSASFTLVNLMYFYSRKRNYARDDFQALMVVCNF